MQFPLVRLRNALLLTCLALGWFATPIVNAQSAPDRASAAAIDLQDLDGNRVTLSQYAGQVVVLSFWATWCRPCLQELPLLEGFYQQHQNAGLVVLAIATDGPETLAQVRAIVRRGRWTMPVLLDSDGRASALHNPRGTNPYTVFIDRQGRVARTHEGFAPGDERSHLSTIEALLAESAP